MYNCEICRAHVGPRVAQQRYVVYRTVFKVLAGAPVPVQQIHREVPVCHECKRELDAGVPLSIMYRQHGRPIRHGTVQAVPNPSERPRTIGKPVFLGRPITRGARANGTVPKPAGATK